MAIHKYMIFVGILALAPLGVFAPAVAQNTAAPAAATITVTGEGVVLAAPDMATISLGVTSTAKTAKAAMDENSTALGTVLEALKAAGIEARDLQTSGLSLQPNWTNSSSGQNTIDGYAARNQLTVTVRALPTLGTVLDAAVKDGANTLDNVSFGVADPAPLLDEARLRAVADARHRAEVVTGAAGVRLGQITTMTEFGGAAGPRGGAMLRASMESVPVEGGEVSFAVNVSISWQVLQ